MIPFLNGLEWLSLLLDDFLLALVAYDVNKDLSFTTLFRLLHGFRLHETASHFTSVVDAACSFLLNRQFHLREDLCLVWYETVVFILHYPRNLNLKSEDVVNVRSWASGFLLVGSPFLFRFKFFWRLVFDLLVLFFVFFFFLVILLLLRFEALSFEDKETAAMADC